MTTRVLITAAGDGYRWFKPEPKQLTDVCGEPVLTRLIRQCLRRGHAPVVLTHLPALATVAEQAGAQVVNPPARRWIVETIASTSSLWADTTHVLLGDVIYARGAVDSILAGTPRLTFYGKQVELLALSFQREAHGELLAALARALAYAEGLEGDARAWGGKLWHTYRALAGIPLDEHQLPEHALRTVVHDWSIDIDDAASYKRFVDYVIEGGRLDDCP